MLDSDGTTLLYHSTLKLWSMLPKCHNDNVPLVNYRGKILAASKHAGVEAFDVSSSTWKAISGPPAKEMIHMTVNCDTLYVYAKKKT